MGAKLSEPASCPDQRARETAPGAAGAAHPGTLCTKNAGKNGDVLMVSIYIYMYRMSVICVVELIYIIQNQLKHEPLLKYKKVQLQSHVPIKIITLRINNFLKYLLQYCM